jgi:hypothetical protein
MNHRLGLTYCIDYSKKGYKLRHLLQSEMLRMQHYILENCDEALSDGEI